MYIKLSASEIVKNERNLKTIKNMNITRAFVAGSLILMGVGVMSAQSYYDDDIYFDETKVKKKTQSKDMRATGQQPVTTVEQGTYDYAPADAYPITSSGANRDVDEYNRRNVSQPADTTSAQSENFSYTRRLERFHNPSIIINSDDPELVEYYYSSAAPNVTINVGTPLYYGSYVGSYWDPWYSYPGWGWNYGWNSWWGPSWSFGWNSWWGPSWGYYPYPGWGPAYYPGWGPAWGPSWTWAPPRPRRPSSPGGWQTVGPRPSHGQPAYNGYRPGRRPSTINNNGNAGGNYRPSTPSSTPANSQGSYRIGNRRTPTTNSGNYDSSRPTRSNNSNYNSNYNHNRSTSQPSYSRPSRGGGNGSFGAGRSGGGGGRRR